MKTTPAGSFDRPIGGRCGAVLWLSSEEARSVTGQAIVVAGGKCKDGRSGDLASTPKPRPSRCRRITERNAPLAAPSHLHRSSSRARCAAACASGSTSPCTPLDLMAQLDKAPSGMTLSDLSKRMMVSNGNLTGLVDPACRDRRIVRGFSDGSQGDGDQFDEVAAASSGSMETEHELWIRIWFGDLTEKRTETTSALVPEKPYPARRLSGEGQ